MYYYGTDKEKNIKLSKEIEKNGNEIISKRTKHY